MPGPAVKRLVKDRWFYEPVTVVACAPIQSASLVDVPSCCGDIPLSRDTPPAAVLDLQPRPAWMREGDDRSDAQADVS
jgi:hypothetical protein